MRIYALALAIALGVLVNTLSARYPRADTEVCAAPEFPVVIPETAGLKLVKHNFLQEGWSKGWIQFQNVSGRTVTGVFVLMSYFDSTGKTIFEIPYGGGQGDSPEEGMEGRLFIWTILEKPVKPLESFLLEGTNLEVTTEYPTRAEATLVEVDFDDGNNSVSFSNPSTSPLLLSLPEFFEFSADARKLPDELVMTFELDERGRVGGVKFGEPGLPNDLVRQLSDQFMRWLFFPATQGGYAVKSQLRALLRFHDKGIPLPAPICPFTLSEKLPRTFVEIDLRRVDERRWQVLYGSYPAHGKFESIVSVTLSDQSMNPKAVQK